MHYAVIFGAAVRADGRPSGSLQRRIDGALNWWATHPDIRFLVTGGIGKHGPAEAEVMRTVLIEAGVDPAHIVIEDKARDTLESVRLCDAILRALDNCDTIICCTSAYHQYRCALLFRSLGYRVTNPPMPTDRGKISSVKLLRFWAKELVATPYDLILLHLGKRS